MIITDSQVHMYPGNPEHPWPEQFPSYRMQPEYLPSTFLPLMDGADVQRAVIVPPSFLGYDNGPALQWAREYPDRFAVMGIFDLRDLQRTRLETWLDQPGMLGIRLGGSGQLGDWLDLEEFSWFWSTVERLRIPIMMLVKDHAIRRVNSLAERYRGVPIIIDHFGVTNGDLANIDPWEHIDDVLALAKHPNVWAKLSALPLNTMEPFPFPSQTPYIKRAYDTFGPKRLAWGTDGSRFRRNTYKEAVDHLLYTVDFLSEDDKDWIMGKSIASVLNWPESLAGDRHVT